MMKTILPILLLHVTLLSFGTNIYVDQQNSGLADGSITSPFQTIAEAVAIASSNDEIHIKSGVYRETISPSTNNLSFIADDDDVYITGTDLITNWVSLGNGLFKSYMPTECTQVFLDTVPQVKARYPNTPAGDNLFEFNTVPIDVTGSTATLSQPHNVDADWVGGTIWMLIDHRWISITARINGYNNNDLDLTYMSTTNFEGDGIAYITNTKQALDTIGEWHWQNDTLYYYFGETGDINSVDIEAQVRTTVINLNYRSNILIEGLKAYSGNVLMNNTNESRLDDCEFKYLNEYHYINRELYSWYNSYSRNEWCSILSHGLGIGVFGSDNVIDGCEVSWSSGDCITLYGDGNRVSNSVIHDANILSGDLCAIALGGTGNIITHNTIYNAGRDVIGFNSAESFKITYNEVHGAGKIAWDLGCLYSYNTDGKNAEIAYNWVHDAQSENPETFWGAQGIYLDNNSRNYVVHHNVVWDCKGQGIQLNMPANNLQVFNNTTFDCEDMLTYLHPAFSGQSSGNCAFSNNYIDGDLLIQPWLSNVNNLSSTIDYLTNRSVNDFSPVIGSPLIDGGVVINNVYPSNGSSPDIGAYEFDGVLWGVGPYSQENTTITALDIESNLTGVVIFPNPTSSYLQITDNEYIYFRVLSMTGQLLKSGPIINDTIGLQEIKHGTYVIEISNDTKSESLKIQKY